METELFFVATDADNYENAKLTSDYAEAYEEVEFQNELARENNEELNYKVFTISVTLHPETAKLSV